MLNVASPAPVVQLHGGALALPFERRADGLFRQVDTVSRAALALLNKARSVSDAITLRQKEGQRCGHVPQNCGGRR